MDQSKYKLLLLWYIPQQQQIDRFQLLPFLSPSRAMLLTAFLKQLIARIREALKKMGPGKKMIQFCTKVMLRAEQIVDHLRMTIDTPGALRSTRPLALLNFLSVILSLRRQPKGRIFGSAGNHCTTQIQSHRDNRNTRLAYHGHHKTELDVDSPQRTSFSVSSHHHLHNVLIPLQELPALVRSLKLHPALFQ